MTAICPYCRTEIDLASTNRLYCNACGTPHHQDCFIENRGCSVFGCKQAPADEPKLQAPQQTATAPSTQTLGQPINAAVAVPARVPQTYGSVPPPPTPNAAPAPNYAPAQYPPPPPAVGSGPAPYGYVPAYGQQAPYAPPQGYQQPPAGYAPAAPYGQQIYAQPPQVVYAQPMPANYQAPKSRVAYVLLGVFLGGLGIHNFYAGYANRGVAQLLISVLTCGYGAIVSWIWALIEICTVDKDSRNIYFN